jgi:hypothetical protein
MVKRIELVGIPGSGKSTVYSLIKKIRGKKKIYSHEEALKICILQLIKEKESSLFKRIIFSFILRHYYLDKILSFSKRIIYTNYNNYNLMFQIEQSKKENDTLKKLLLDLQKRLSFSRFLEISYKFRMRSIDLYLFDKYLAHDCVIIQDESFLQSSSFNPPDMLYYCNNMSSIFGVVLFSANIKIIYDRLLTRKKVIYNHGTYKKQNTLYKLLEQSIISDHNPKIEAIKKSRKKVLEIDIEKKPKENAGRIIDFAKQMLEQDDR